MHSEKGKVASTSSQDKRTKMVAQKLCLASVSSATKIK
jgi:hypothetical protein